MPHARVGVPPLSKGSTNGSPTASTKINAFTRLGCLSASKTAPAVPCEWAIRITFRLMRSTSTITAFWPRVSVVTGRMMEGGGGRGE
jgi:hypothetical protein